MISEPSQEERAGRGRAISRSPASISPATISPEDSSTTVHASQVIVLLYCITAYHVWAPAWLCHNAASINMLLADLL